MTYNDCEIMNELISTSNTHAWKKKFVTSSRRRIFKHIFPFYLAIAAAFIYCVLASTSIFWNGAKFDFHSITNNLPLLEEESSSSRLSDLPPIPSRSLANGQDIAWFGDNWIPPRGCRIYSIAELAAIFSNFSILWIGDSTVRRSYMTLRAILDSYHNATTDSISMTEVDSPHVIDRNKDNTLEEPCHRWKNVKWIDPTSLCHSLGPTSQNFDYILAKCFRDIHYVINNLTAVPQQKQLYNLIVVSGGTWEMSPHKRHECSPSGRKRHFDKERMWYNLEYVLQDLHKLQSSRVHVVWRNLPINQHELEKVLWMDTNELVQNDIKTFLNVSTNGNLSYIDMATALKPRSVLYDRIEGNNIYHFGLKGRLLFIQILANHLLWEMNQWKD